MDLAELYRGASAKKRPTDTAPVIRAGGERPELVSLRWGLEPDEGDQPVINIRAETGRLEQNRCVVPTTGFFLFTGSDYPKSRWRVRVRDTDWFCLAGIWREASGSWPESYAIVTIEAAPDLVSLTERQMAVILPDEAPRWLEVETPAAELLRPLPRGSYVVELG